MYIGDNGKDFEELQDWLYDLGFIKVKEPFYSTKTKKAVALIEEALGYEPTGVYKESYKQEFMRNVMTNFAVRAPRNDLNTENPLNNGKVPNANSSGLTTVGRETPCYIINTLTQAVIHLPHVPEEFSYSHGSNWDEQSTKGRSVPHINYSGGGSRTVDVSVTLCADYCENRDIELILNRLEALTYPIYKDKILSPRCVFRCASFSVTGVINSVDITRKLPIINGSYSQADVSISFIEIFDSAPQANSIEGGKR